MAFNNVVILNVFCFLLFVEIDANYKQNLILSLK